MPRAVTVGIPASLSGQFRIQGRQALAGLEAWAEDVNRAGGLKVRSGEAGNPVTVVHYDDESEPDRVREITGRLIAGDRVDLLMGPYSSVLARTAAAVAEEQGQVLWNQGGAADGIYRRGYSNVVGILTPASEYLAGLAAVVREADPEARRLAIVRATPGAFPRVVSSGAERSARGLGFETVLLREYDPSEPDFGTIVAQLRRLRPHVLVAVGRIHNDLELAQRLVEARPEIGAVAVVATPIGQFRDALGPAVDGFTGPSQWEPDAAVAVDFGPTPAQVMESLTRYAPGPVDYPMAQSYAAGLIAQRCVEDAGSLDQRGLRRAAGELDFSTFYGRFKIDPVTGRQVGRSVALVQWQRGRKVIVWPPEQRQAGLAYPWG